MSWLQIVVLRCHLFLFYTTVIHFSIRLQCVTKSGFYMATSDNQLSGWIEKKLQSTSQSQICTHTRTQMVTVRWSAAWSDPLWLFESQQNHYIWEECSVNQRDAPKIPMPAAGSQQGRSHPWQGHAERPDGHGESGLKGSSAWASTLKPKSVCLLSAVLYSSDITGAIPDHLSLEKVNLELQLVSCIWKECLGLKSPDGSLTCLTVGDFYNLWLFTAPNHERHEA